MNDPGQTLEKLVQRIIGTKKPIRDADLIYHDLGIGGDDAGELLDDIHEKFKTSFEGLSFHQYFPNELDAFLLHIARLFGHKGKRYKPLSMGHLKDVIRKGKWFDPA